MAQGGTGGQTATSALNNLIATSNTGIVPQTYPRIYNPNTSASAYQATNQYSFNVNAFLLPRWSACTARVKINAGTVLATQQQYVAAMYALALSNNLPIIDNFSRWGSYELKNPAPLSYYGNTLHPDAVGYSDFAQSVASQLLSTSGH